MQKQISTNGRFGKRTFAQSQLLDPSPTLSSFRRISCRRAIKPASVRRVDVLEL
jgi:hypothetical protein